MRYAEGHKEETRKHIVKVASQCFRREGIEKIGVATLMEEAGLTVGGFYSHFKSKEGLIKEAVLCAAEETSYRLLEAADSTPGDGLKALLEAYLNVAHRHNPQSGCVIAALASELINRPDKTRAAVANHTENFVNQIADRLSPEADHDRRVRAARSIWALMVGTMQVARLVSDEELSAQILEDGIANALKLASEASLERSSI